MRLLHKGARARVSSSRTEYYTPAYSYIYIGILYNIAVTHRVAVEFNSPWRGHMLNVLCMYVEESSRFFEKKQW